MAELAGLGALGLLVLGALALGTQQPPQDTLAAARSMTCEFGLVAASRLANGDPKAELREVTPPFRLRFEEISATEGSARINEPLGVFPVVVHLSSATLHLIQMSQEGSLYTTTVFDMKNRAGKLAAAHSRHEYLASTLPMFALRPQQYYGECEITQ